MGRKSIALPTILNIFLMVAVILVASSFLLKAFGIDIFGFFKNLTEKLTGPEPAKILHAKLDPNKYQVYEFHLTNGEPARNYGVSCFDSRAKAHLSGDDQYFYFYENDIPSDKCILFTTDENTVDNLDTGFVYVINQGAVIQTDDERTNIEDGISSFVDKKGCYNVNPSWGLSEKERACQGTNCFFLAKCEYGKCEYNLMGTNTKLFNAPCTGILNIIATDKTPLDISSRSWMENACNNKELVVKYKFADESAKKGTGWYGDCRESIKSKVANSNCNLLNLKDNTYQIKYGLLCAIPENEKNNVVKWIPCISSLNERPRTVEDKAQGKKLTYTCKWDENSKIGKWVETSSEDLPISGITLTSPNGGELLRVGEAYTITWKSVKTSGKINISLCKGGFVTADTCATSPIQIAKDLTDTGSYSWTFSGIEEGDDYQILIQSKDSTQYLYDKSDNFFSIRKPLSGYEGAPIIGPISPTSAFVDVVTTFQATVQDDKEVKMCKIAFGADPEIDMKLSQSSCKMCKASVDYTFPSPGDYNAMIRCEDFEKNGTAELYKISVDIQY